MLGDLAASRLMLAVALRLHLGGERLLNCGARPLSAAQIAQCARSEPSVGGSGRVRAQRGGNWRGDACAEHDVLAVLEAPITRAFSLHYPLFRPFCSLRPAASPSTGSQAPEHRQQRQTWPPL